MVELLSQGRTRRAGSPGTSTREEIARVFARRMPSEKGTRGKLSFVYDAHSPARLCTGCGACTARCYPSDSCARQALAVRFRSPASSPIHLGPVATGSEKPVIKLRGAGGHEL